MTAEEFVVAFYNEREEILNEYKSDSSETQVARLIKSMKLTDEQEVIMDKVLASSLTDFFYTVMLGLDGKGAIGGITEAYNLKDKSGNQISGKIEEFVFEYFQDQE